MTRRQIDPEEVFVSREMIEAGESRLAQMIGAFGPNYVAEEAYRAMEAYRLNHQLPRTQKTARKSDSSPEYRQPRDEALQSEPRTSGGEIACPHERPGRRQRS
jgi:hypothetical protein